MLGLGLLVWNLGKAPEGNEPSRSSEIKTSLQNTFANSAAYLYTSPGSGRSEPLRTLDTPAFSASILSDLEGKQHESPQHSLHLFVTRTTDGICQCYQCGSW